LEDENVLGQKLNSFREKGTFKSDQWFFCKLRKTQFPQWKSSPNVKVSKNLSTEGTEFFIIYGKTIDQIS